MRPPCEASWLPPAAACPRCGESDVDALAWLDDDRAGCSSCGHVYEPGTGLGLARVNEARQAEYQRKMSALLAGR